MSCEAREKAFSSFAKENAFLWTDFVESRLRRTFSDGLGRLWDGFYGVRYFLKCRAVWK